MSIAILLDQPGPEARALAEKELRETEENVKKGIETLRKYLEGWCTYFSQFKSKVRNVYPNLANTNYNIT